MFDLQTIKRLLKPSLRKPKFLAYIQRLLTRGKTVADNFTSFKVLWDERRLYSPQVLSLQTYLRNYYNDQTILVLSQSNSSLKTYVYWLFQNQTKSYVYWLSEPNPVYIYWLGEYDTLDYDFCVQCPLSLQGSLGEIRSIVDVMKLAGKRYKVTFV